MKTSLIGLSMSDTAPARTPSLGIFYKLHLSFLGVFILLTVLAVIGMSLRVQAPVESLDSLNWARFSLYALGSSLTLTLVFALLTVWTAIASYLMKRSNADEVRPLRSVALVTLVLSSLVMLFFVYYYVDLFAGGNDTEDLREFYYFNAESGGIRTIFGGPELFEAGAATDGVIRASIGLLYTFALAAPLSALAFMASSVRTLSVLRRR